MQESICRNTAKCEPLISIIVPVYNVEKYLDSCLDSICNQTYRNLEIMIVDDGSPDRCPEICDAWKVKDERIKVIHQQNMGLSGARNTGLKDANGEYIAFVDSDDIISDSYINAMYEAIVRTGADIAGCDSTSKIEELYSSNDGEKFESTVTDNPLLFYLENESDAVWHRLYSRALLENLSFEVGEQNEDIVFTYNVFKNANRYVTLSCKLYYWNVVPPSLSRCAVKSLKNQSARVVEMLRKNGASKKEIDAAEVRSAQFTFRIITRILRFGAADWMVNKEYGSQLESYRKQLREDFSLIMKSSKFRAIDKIQICMIITSYSAYKAVYVKSRETLRANRGGEF